MPEYADLHRNDDPLQGVIGRIFVLSDGVAIFYEDPSLLAVWGKPPRNQLSAILRDDQERRTAVGARNPTVVDPTLSGGGTFAGVNWSGTMVQPDRAMSLPLPELSSLRGAARAIGILFVEPSCSRARPFGP